MADFVAWFASLVLAGLGGLHYYWAFGGKAGARAAVPDRPDGEPLFRPGKPATLAVGTMLLAAGALLLAHRGLLPLGLSGTWTQWGCLLGGAVFMMRTVGDFKYVGFFKKVRGTAFAASDTRLYSPLCLLLAACFAISALTPL
ncbi:DUF3995 domain-containing protein [Cohnella sp.]|uniref:DUF3995 domain-containing protein n=1 Tax=Cohnella sp. TaxID=1883426 RepID=UPI003564118E